MGAKSGALTIRGLVLYALLGTVMFALKTAMSGLPNIEPVSLLVILYTLTFRLRAFWPIALYVLLETLTWGINLWTISYLYVWAILALLTLLFRSMESVLGWAVLSGTFGLCFGLLCTPISWVTGGAAFALSWWISGIPYDLLHCAGNFFIALALFRPCRKVLGQLRDHY